MCIGSFPALMPVIKDKCLQLAEAMCENPKSETPSGKFAFVNWISIFGSGDSEPNQAVSEPF